MIELGNEEHGHRLAKARNSVFSPIAETCISRSKNGILLGGLIYSNYYKNASIWVHIASFKPNWISRSSLWFVFAYPFLQLQCKVMIGHVNSNYAPAVRFSTHVGFKKVYTIPDAMPGGDLHVFTMYREECKWLKIKPKRFEFYDHLKAKKEAA